MKPAAPFAIVGPDGTPAPLLEVVKQIALGELASTAARAAWQAVPDARLQEWITREALELDRHLSEDGDLRLALLELGCEQAFRMRVERASFEFEWRLGYMLAAGRHDVDRGIALLDHAVGFITPLQLSPSEFLPVLLHVGEAYYTQRRHEPAYYQVAGQAFEAVIRMAAAVSPVVLARAHAGRGLFLMEADESDIPSAISHYEAGLKILASTDETFWRGLLLHQLANAWRWRTDGNRVDNLHLSARHFAEAIVLRQGEPRRLRLSCTCLAEVEFELGHRQNAIAHMERALETLHPVRERSEFAKTQALLARYCRMATTLDMNQVRELQSLARAANVVARASSSPEEDPQTWAVASAGLAALSNESGDRDRALALYEEIFRHVDPVAQAGQLSRIAADSIQVLAEAVEESALSGDLESARPLLARAHAVARFLLPGEAEPHVRALCAASLAEMEAHLAEDEPARHAHRMAARQAVENTIRQLPADAGFAIAEFLEDKLLRADLKVGLFEEAMAIAKRRLGAEAEFLRAGPTLQEYLNFCDHARHCRDALVSCALASRSVLQAWQAADQARGRMLDVLGTAAASPKSRATLVPAEYKARHAQLIEDWLANADPDNFEQSERRRMLAPWIRQSLEEAERWRGEWTLASVCEIPSAPPTLEPGTAMVEYWIGRQEACAFVWLPGGQEPHVVPLPALQGQAKLDWLSDWFHHYSVFENSGNPVTWAHYFEVIGRALGEACWAPLRPLLQAAHCRRLVVIPDSMLSLLPLQSMWLPSDGGRLWFVDEHDVVFSASARQYARGLQRNRIPISEVLFVGDPTPLSRPVPLAKREWEEVRSLWPQARAVFGNEATPAAVLAAFSENSPHLVHFAAHGHTTFVGPLASGLILSSAGTLRKDPLALYLWTKASETGQETEGEVLTLDWILREAILKSCQLVFLGACEAGLPNIQGMREYLSIASGFLAAGVAAVVAPLWPTPDAVTALFSRYFYAWLASHPGDYLGALGAARQTIRTLEPTQCPDFVTPDFLEAAASISGPARPFSHPFFWAAFQLHGASS